MRTFETAAKPIKVLETCAILYFFTEYIATRRRHVDAYLFYWLNVEGGAMLSFAVFTKFATDVFRTFNSTL